MAGIMMTHSQKSARALVVVPPVTGVDGSRLRFDGPVLRMTSR